jgi:putative membrane protein
MEENRALEKRLNLIAYITSGVVLTLIVLMGSPKKLNLGIDFGFLPPIHATFNAIAAVMLIGALWAIKGKNMELHRRFIYAAFVCSALFLVSYVLYHSTTPEVKFGDLDHDGKLTDLEKVAVSGQRPWYLTLLFTHIVIAGVSLPFILLTFIRAYTNQFARHKKMARWVYPFWLFVAITGPLCYLWLRPYYP